jgi:hypothetical protein
MTTIDQPPSIVSRTFPDAKVLMFQPRPRLTAAEALLRQKGRRVDDLTEAEKQDFTAKLIDRAHWVVVGGYVGEHLFIAASERAS